jgi:TRAP-type mannitol/chloroaromatic compound transport system permease small subunit
MLAFRIARVRSVRVQAEQGSAMRPDRNKAIRNNQHRAYGEDCLDLLAGFVRAVDAINEWIGRIVMWMALGIVLVCFATVYLRYALGTGQPWMQELYVWQHAFVFLVGAGYTLLHGGHVRVDLFYGPMTPRRKAMIDLLGVVVFLLPFCVVIGYETMAFVEMSWRNREISVQPGGMPAVYILKASLQAFCFLVAVQGLAIAARSVLVLSGREEFTAIQGTH